MNNIKAFITILLTGATGFLGGELLVLLSKSEKIKKIYCLIRAENQEAADKRLEAVFAFHNDYFDREKVVAIVGNLTSENLIDQLKNLTDVNMVLHAAADTSFNAINKENIFKVNVDGATSVARWAASLPNLKTFAYIGTAWIRGCDNPDRVVEEDESPKPSYTQLVDYTKSKTEGEMNIRNIISADKLLVMRPSIILGDSRPWIPRSFEMSWAPVAFDLMRLIPIRARANNDVVSVDYAAKAIVALLFNDSRHFNTYHISSGIRSVTNMEMFTNAINNSNGSRPPFKFVDYKFMEQMQLYAKGQLPENADLRAYSEYLEYWSKLFPKSRILRRLLWGINLYYQFLNLGIVFDNSRLLEDTTVGLPEPAHVYMARNKGFLRHINAEKEAENP